PPQIFKLLQNVPVGFRRVNEGLLIPRTPQVTRQRVIILRRDRIKLVVVAAGAGDGLTEKSLAEDVELIVDAVGLVLADIDGSLLPFVHPPKAGGQDRLVRAIERMASRLWN